MTYLLPGILLITIASGISYSAFRLFTDMQSGIFERFQSMPIARSSVLWSHVLTSLVANLISLVVVLLVAAGMGFRPGSCLHMPYRTRPRSLVGDVEILGWLSSERR